MDLAVLKFMMLDVQMEFLGVPLKIMITNIYRLDSTNPS